MDGIKTLKAESEYMRASELVTLSDVRLRKIF